MPELPKFLSGFGLIHGLQLGSYTLSSVFGEHVQVTRYREYEYPLTVSFEGSGTPQSLLRALDNFTGQKKIIYTSYGNPYECNIEPWSIKSSSENQVVLVSTGHSYRV